MAELALTIAGGLEVSWDLDAAREGSPRPWRFEGEPEGASAVRVLTGLTDKGALLLLAAARDADSDGHDAEEPAAVRVSPNGETTAMGESLLSTQYSGDGAITRFGLELYPDGDDYPLRGAGDVTATAAENVEGRRHEIATADFRFDGESGSATYEIVRI